MSGAARSRRYAAGVSAGQRSAAAMWRSSHLCKAPSAPHRLLALTLASEERKKSNPKKVQVVVGVALDIELRFIAAADSCSPSYLACARGGPKMPI